MPQHLNFKGKFAIMKIFTHLISSNWAKVKVYSLFCPGFVRAWYYLSNPVPEPMSMIAESCDSSCIAMVIALE